jgi:hypothetical protein
MMQSERPCEVLLSKSASFIHTTHSLSRHRHDVDEDAGE